MVRQLHRLALVAATAVVLVPAGLAADSASSGRALAWGDNAAGQLGNGTVTRYGGIPTPGPVVDLSGATAVAGGSDFSLALG